MILILILTNTKKLKNLYPAGVMFGQSLTKKMMKTNRTLKSLNLRNFSDLTSHRRLLKQRVISILTLSGP